MSKPEIVVLCGSTRFYHEFQRANFDLTMQGKVVLSVGFYAGSPDQMMQEHGEGVGITPGQKVALDELHKRKIDLADRVFVLNVGGYIGESTQSEIDYALAHNRPVDYLEPPPAPKPEPLTPREELGKLIWDTSHTDESTISATGANIIADAILTAGYELLPCDGGCSWHDGPEETCSRHGRSIADVWEMEQRATAEANHLRNIVESALALHPVDDEWTQHGIPVFDEFDRSTERRRGCKRCNYYVGPCPTRVALTAPADNGGSGPAAAPPGPPVAAATQSDEKGTP